MPTNHTWRMSEAAVLRDCLDTLKYASTSYLRASHEADSDVLRKTFDRLAVDKSEQKNAVFNLMHQAGHYRTWPAQQTNVDDLRRRVSAVVARMGTGRAVPRERGPMMEEYMAFAPSPPAPPPHRDPYSDASYTDTHSVQPLNSAVRSYEPEFHRLDRSVHPHYRSAPPIEAAHPHNQAAHDELISGTIGGEI